MIVCYSYGNFSFGQYLCIYYTQQFLRILFDLNGPRRKHCACCPAEEELPRNEYGKYKIN